MIRHLPFFVLVLSVVFSRQDILPAEVRVFTSTAGTTLRGELVEVKGEAITIRREDGQLLTVNAATLSAADLAYLQAHGVPSINVPTRGEAIQARLSVNSLGMTFVPVPGTSIFMCIHETRRQDYAAYANEVPGVDSSWKNQQRDGIPIGDKDDHPVVSVNWEDARAFCAWLSKKEGKTYRLPTDREWSFAVGIGSNEKVTTETTPRMLSQKQPGFPYGMHFPPKTEDLAGNYADSSWHETFPARPWIEGYKDGFPTTSPVMRFKPNELGLYDLGGNVWEWVEDSYGAAKPERALRGGSWGDNTETFLLSSQREHFASDTRFNFLGFRCAMVVNAPAVADVPAVVNPPGIVPPRVVPPPVAPPAAAKSPAAVKGSADNDARRSLRILEDVLFPDWNTTGLSQGWSGLPQLQLDSDDPELSAFAQASFADFCKESGLQPAAGDRVIEVHIGEEAKIKKLIAKEKYKPSYRDGSAQCMYWNAKNSLERSVMFISRDKFANGLAKADVHLWMAASFGLWGYSQELKEEDQSTFSHDFARVQTMSPLDRRLLSFIYKNIPPGTKKAEVRSIFRKKWEP